MRNILYVTYAFEHFDGATFSMFNMIESLKGKIYPIVLCRGIGDVTDYCSKHDIEYIVYDYGENIYIKPRNVKSYIKFFLSYYYKKYKNHKKDDLCLSQLAVILKEKKISIVHTNTGVVTIGFKLAKAIDAKHVWHLREFQDLDFGWGLYSGWTKLKKMISESDAVVGITNILLSHFISPIQSNTFVIYNAVRRKRDACVMPKEKYFLFCAMSLCETKGVDIAIKAFALSKLYEEGYRLRIVGRKTEGYQKTLETIMDEHSIKSNVDFIGESNDVKSHMAHAQAFLMCSQNEAMGRVTIEAMFYGTPVIGRYSGGTKEIVSNEETGYLFDTVEECADLMIKTVRSDNTQLIKRAQSFAVDNFSLENYSTKICDVYNKLTISYSDICRKT